MTMVKIFENKATNKLIIIPNDNLLTSYSLKGFFNKDATKIPNNWFYLPIEDKILIIDKTETGHTVLNRIDVIPILDSNLNRIYIKQSYTQFPKTIYFEYVEPTLGSYNVYDTTDFNDVTDTYSDVVDELYNKIKIDIVNSDTNLFTIENNTWWNFDFNFSQTETQVSGFVLNPDELYVQDFPHLAHIIYDVDIKKSENSYWMVTVNYEKETGKFKNKTVAIESPTYQYSIKQIFDMFNTQNVSIIYQYKFRNRLDYLKMFTVSD